MSSGEVKIECVKVGERHRTDLGDIGALMASMREVGTLLQPIVLDKDLNLIAGFRRLEAAKRLRWPTVSCRVVNGLDDAVKALHAERDENTCRKNFTPSELASMGAAIEAVEAPKAAERKAQAGLANLPTVSGALQNPTHETATPKGRTNDKVADALGVSATHYRRAKRVVNAAEDPANPAHAAAVEARAAMDSGELTVYAAAEKVATATRRAAMDKIVPGKPDKSRAAVAERRERITALAARGYDRDQIARELGISPRAVGKTANELGVKVFGSEPGQRGQRKVDPNTVMENMCDDLAQQFSVALSLLEGRYAALDPAKVESWTASLENSRKSLNRLLSNIKETIRA